MALDGIRQKNNRLKAVIIYSVVPRVGLEPTHLAAGDFESPASTNFATWAFLIDETDHGTGIADKSKA